MKKKFENHHLVDLILLDHKQVKEDCSKMIELGVSKVEKFKIGKNLVKVIEAQIKAENQILYKRIQTNRFFKNISLEAYSEHEVILGKLKSIKSKISKSKQLKVDLEIDFKVLAKIYLNHLMFEEGEVLPMIQKNLDKIENYKLGVDYLKIRKLDQAKLGPYPILEDEIIHWKDSLQKLSAELLIKMDKNVEELRH